MTLSSVSLSDRCGYLCGRGSIPVTVVRTCSSSSSVRYNKRLQATAASSCGWLLAATLALSGLEPETLSNVPQSLSSSGCEAESASSSLSKDCQKPRIQHPKSRRAESCTVKCVNTCIRGGDGAPGEGPLNIRRPLVVFKQGFRSRQYCLVECSDICNLIGDGDDGP
ncbi:hypothetical protein MLD38_030605 [Melastoma candidum]|uniref:Uncharacterized protein n=1 Tax=Melastoma candidum TaxID=119954 RepID=A0ACB9MNP7_9MYRT|nr:hypothetical protein MLD38_030605 [Melastoma candidum]